MSAQISSQEALYINNWGIIGHEWAVNALRQHVMQGIHRQAYLITGPDSVGKRSLAIRFAQAMNCLQPPLSGVPCLECSACEQLDRMVHPDLTVIQSDSKGAQLKVDQVRELQYSLHLAPYEAKYRTALLLRFEEATESAANALLKTIEEPPNNVVMLITAENTDRLLPTIVSRCEVIRLQHVPGKILAPGLQMYLKIPTDEAELLANLSAGRPGYCITLYQKPEILSQRIEWIEDLNFLLSESRVARFAYVEKLTKNRDPIYPLLGIWLGFWRDVMLRNRSPKSQIVNVDYQERIDALARQIQKDKLLQVVSAIDRIQDLIIHNINPRLAFEDLMLILPFNTKLSNGSLNF